MLAAYVALTILMIAGLQALLPSLYVALVGKITKFLLPLSAGLTAGLRYHQLGRRDRILSIVVFALLVNAGWALFSLFPDKLAKAPMLFVIGLPLYALFAVWAYLGFSIGERIRWAQEQNRDEDGTDAS
ncbi:MAG: hypothetical protein IPL79_07225 [Myxococcales bacterium]|nr:hypothetical protein [Myxococcales bacterium]